MDEHMRNEAQETEFNASVASLIRIDALKRVIDERLDREDYFGLWRALVPYYMELDPVFNDKDQKEQFDKYNLLTQKYNEMKYAFKNKHKKIPNHTQYFLLWHLELRRLEQKYGLNMPKKGDARWAMARR